MPLACGLLLSAQASATDIVFDFGDVLITPSNPQEIIQNVSLGSGWDVVGFTFEGTYIHSHSFFATDARLDIWGPGGFHYAVGGYDNHSDNSWQFGDGAGHKFHSEAIGPTPADGDWTVRIINDWSSSSGHNWEGLTVTLHAVPAPGSLALLGLAGAFVARRRR